MLRKLIDELKKSEAGRQLIPLKTGFGLPAVYLAGKRLLVVLPLLQRTGKPGPTGQVELKKPVGEVRFDLAATRLTKFQLYLTDDPLPEISWDAPFAQFPPPAVIEKRWTREDYYRERNVLFQSVDSLTRRWVEKGRFDERDLRAYKRQFHVLLELGMLPYYEAIVPEGLYRAGSRRSPQRNSHDAPLTPFD